MEEKNIITREGLKELNRELKKLIEDERPNAIAEIKEAREQGDLSENAEFDAARERQGKIEDRIAEIEMIISESKIVDSKQTTSNKIRIGSTVVVEHKKREQSYLIVGALEADPFQSKISNVSPLGKALLQHQVGDEVTYDVETKSGIKKYKVLIKAVKINK